jgi:hypothetical protein
MTAELLTNISKALAQTFATELTRNWNRKAVFLQNIRIVSGAGQGGGQNVGWDVEFSTSGATAATFTEGADITTYTQDPVTKATLAWGMYQSSFSLSNLEINAASANVSNATALEDIVGERFLGAIAAICDKMETDCFSGTAAPAIVGLDTAIAATGSYAGVSTGTYTEWKGNVQANGGTPQALTMNQLATAENLAFVASGMEPDFLMTTPAVYAKYEALFNPSVRTVQDGSKPIPAFQGSSGRLFWRGKPIIRNRRATAGHIYMLNSDELELVVLPWANVPDGVMTVTRNAMSSNGKDADTVAIPFKVYPLARTGSAVKFAVEVYAQLKVKRPNAHVNIADVLES